MKGKLRIAALFICVVFLFASVACGAPSAAYVLTLKDEVFRAPLYIGKAYSIDNVVEKESGVNYTIKQLFYLDGEFKKHDIPNDGTVFTQNEPYDVTLEIEGEKDGSKDSEVVEIKINFNSNAVLDALISSWCDEGVIKTLSARKEYLSGNAETALSMRYMGSYDHLNITNDGVNFGSFMQGVSECSVTDWANAVFTMDIYNAAPYNLQLGWQLTKDSEAYEIYMNDELPAGEWTKITWSLRSIGYTENYFSEKGGFSFKIRCADETQRAPYDYTVYLCNIDIADYSAEKFPDLETRTEEEIKRAAYESLPGDELDRKMVCYTSYSPNYTATTDTEIVKEGASSVKYTFTRDPLKNYPTSMRGNFLLSADGALNDYFTIDDWKNVYLGFWVNSPTNALNIAVRFQNSADGKTFKGAEEMQFGSYTAHKDIPASSEWQYVEFALSDLFELYTEEVAAYKLCLCNEIASAQDGVPVSFYIDGLKIFSKAPVDARDTKIKTLTALSDNYTSEINADAAYVKAGNSSLKYTFTKGASGEPAGSPARGRFLYIESEVGETDLFGLTSAADWSNLYVGFWFKQEAVLENAWVNLAVRFQTSQDGTTFKGSDEMSFGRHEANSDRPNNTEWQYVEFKISDLFPDMYKTDVTKYRFSLNTETSAETATFYIDELAIYAGSKAQ